MVFPLIWKDGYGAFSLNQPFFFLVGGEVEVGEIGDGTEI